jgi:hypothetical protein
MTDRGLNFSITLDDDWRVLDPDPQTRRDSATATVEARTPDRRAAQGGASLG